MHFAASFVVTGGQTVSYPTPCLGPGPWAGCESVEASFPLTSGSKLLGSTGVGKASILGFQMLGVSSTAGPHRAPENCVVDLEVQEEKRDSSPSGWMAALTI